jgi:hypothetical protein
MSEYACKHCGGVEFYAEVTVSGWCEGFIDRNHRGNLSFERDGSAQDTEFESVDRIVCNGCRKGSYRVEDLVVATASTTGAVCGRCDHQHHEHPYPEGLSPADGDTRPKMRCTHEGCDCHDYYDPEPFSGYLVPRDPALAA